MWGLIPNLRVAVDGHMKTELTFPELASYPCALLTRLSGDGLAIVERVVDGDLSGDSGGKLDAAVVANRLELGDADVLDTTKAGAWCGAWVVRIGVRDRVGHDLSPWCGRLLVFGVGECGESSSWRCLPTEILSNESGELFRAGPPDELCRRRADDS